MVKAGARTDDCDRSEDEENVLPQFEHWVRDMSNTISDEAPKNTSPPVEGTPYEHAKWHLSLSVPDCSEDSQSGGHECFHQAKKEARY